MGGMKTTADKAAESFEPATVEDDDNDPWPPRRPIVIDKTKWPTPKAHNAAVFAEEAWDLPARARANRAFRPAQFAVDGEPTSAWAHFLRCAAVVGLAGGLLLEATQYYEEALKSKLDNRECI
jgi:hypothetical protein